MSLVVAAASSPHGELFVDDQELLTEILAGNTDNADSFVERFLSDHPVNQEVSASQVSLPEFLQSDVAQLHLKVLQDILQISQTTAVQITLGVFVQRNQNNMGNLLGTLTLVAHCVEFHYAQRACRLDILSELLRLNEPPDIDHLFERLVAASTQEDMEMSYQKFMRLKQLDSALWEAFAQQTILNIREYQITERVEALESLLVLLYDRPTDCADLLHLLDVFTYSSKIRRQNDLQDLIIVESMCLWKIFDKDENIPDWKAAHPMLQGTPTTTWETISLKLQENNNAVGLLAFGLLLYCGGQPDGLELAKFANNEMDGFDKFGQIMNRMVISHGSEPELSAPSLAYASIGRELLNATIFVFKDALLPKHKLPNIVNVARLSGLVQAIFCNSPTLCERFWNVESPLTELWDGADRLARAALLATGYSVGELLDAMAPMIQLAASLSYADVLDDIFDVLPSNLFKHAVKLCLKVDDVPSAFIIMKSIRTLTSLCNTAKSRTTLRDALNQEPGHRQGPRTLSTDIKYPELLSIWTDLSMDSDYNWLLDAWRGLIMVRQSPGWRKLLKTKPAAVRLVVCLVDQLDAIVFNCSEDVVLELLSNLKHIVFEVGDLLLHWRDISYVIAGSVFELLASTIDRLQRLQGSKVRDAALDILDALIASLASNNTVSEIVGLFATAPVSLSIAAFLHPLLRESYLLHQAKSDEMSLFDRGHRPNSGYVAGQIEKLLIDRLASVDAISLDLVNAKAAGWLCEESDTKIPLRSAISSLRLLNAWIRFVSSADDKTPDLLGLSPYRLIGAPMLLPPQVQSHTLFPQVWSSKNVSMLSLLVGYMGKKDGTDLEGALAIEAYDLIAASIQHWRVFSNDDPDTIRDVFRCMNHSGVFTNIMQKLHETVESLPSLSDSDLLEIAVLSRHLNMLGVLVESGPEVTMYVFGKTAAVTLKSYVEVVCVVLNDLESGNSDGDSSLSDAMVEARCRIAVACLTILGAIWKHCRESSENFKLALLHEFISKEEKLLKVLIDFTVNVSGRGISDRDSGGQYLTLQESLVTLTSQSLDVLATELSWGAKEANFPSATSITDAVTEALRGDLTRVVSATRTFSTLKGFLPFGIAIKLSEANRHGTAVNQAVSIEPCKRGPLQRTSLLETEKRLLGCELTRLKSWTGFCRMLLRFLGTWRQSSLTFPFTASPGDFSWSMILTVLQTTKESADSVDKVQSLTTTLRILEHEFLAMAHTSTELLLAIIEMDELKDEVNREQWAEGVESIAEIVRKVARRDAYDSKLFFATTSYLIASAMKLIAFPLENETNAQLESRSMTSHESTLLNLVWTTCEGIKRMDSIDEESSEAKDFLSVALSFLTVVVEEASSSGNTGLAVKLARSLQEANILSSLISQVGNLSVQRIDIILLSLLLDLCTTISLAGNSELMRLLVQSNIAVLLSCCCSSLKQFEGYIEIRGYRDVGAPILSGTSKRTNDPLHGLWRKSLKLVNVLLRSSKEHGSLHDNIGRHFYRLGCDFINTNKAVVLACLRQCGSIDFGPDASERKAFSINLLREASLILGIIAELFDEKSSESLKSLSPELHGNLKIVVAGVVVSLSTILGASGSSREIFRVLEAAERGADPNRIRELQLSMFSPAHRLLAGGLQNAKHEAIRYASHFVLNCRQVLTSQEIEARSTFTDHWQGESQDVSAVQSWSMSSLEKKCRSAVANHFSFSLEFEAAYCLFFALDILWKAHPASSAFVMLSYEEAQQLNSMEFVRQGTVIAFRPVVYQPSSPSFMGPDLENEKLEFGRVLSCDTLQRKWRIQLLNATNCEQTISAEQLAGIQDRAKRMKPMFAIATSQNSLELEALGRAASVGHLILALQWCGQFYDEQKDAAHLQGKLPVVARLAELTSAFVGLELLIFEESSGGELFKPSNSQSPVLAWQLLDLYGDTSAVPEGLREGRLKNVVSKASWDTARSQLKNYLDGAINEVKSKLGEVEVTRGMGSIGRF